MPRRRYTLTIMGVTEYDDEDAQIENLLKGDWSDAPKRIEVAFQELEEEAEELRVKMELIEEE